MNLPKWKRVKLIILVLEGNYLRSNIASTSTATPKGRLLELTAALACEPDSPNTFLIKSDAPFITIGCSVKSSEEFTNPVSFRQDLIFDKSSPHAFFACEIILNAHLLAAS